MGFGPPNSLMSGDRIKSWSFKERPLGTSYVGTVVETDWKQQTDYDTGDLMWWNPGESRPNKVKTSEESKPVWQYVVTLQTDERDDADDDGLRRDFVPMGKGGTQKLQAALKAAGIDAADIPAGTKYMKTFVATEPASNPRFNDRKVYQWQMKAGAAPAASLDGPPASAPAQAEAPVVAPSIDDF